MTEAPRTASEAAKRLQPFQPLTLEHICLQLDLQNLASEDLGVRLTKTEAQRLGRAINVLQRASDVHRGTNNAAIWCLAELPALGRQTPIQKCQTEEGYRRVLGLLGQIEHGVFG